MPPAQPAPPHPREVIADAFDSFRHVAISFSGAEDVALIDMASQVLGRAAPVFVIDTGRLHPETLRFFETVRDRYGTAIEVLLPDAPAVATLVRNKGLFSFYRDGHSECCEVRKVAPLRRKLATLHAWVTGQRRDQSATRANLPVRQIDDVFSAPDHPLTKFNPLAHWSAARVWGYIRANDVPYNPLHDRGMPSIGCEPCTRPVGPHQHEREGRWWWEAKDAKECGLHRQNLVPAKALA